VIKKMLNESNGQQYLDHYLQAAANDRNVSKSANGFVVKGYVLDAEEVSDNAVIGIVEQRFRRLRNLAA